MAKRWVTVKFENVPFSDLIEMEFFKKLGWHDKAEFITWYLKITKVPWRTEDLALLKKIEDEVKHVYEIFEWRQDCIKKLNTLRTKLDKINYLNDELANLLLFESCLDLIQYPGNLLPSEKIPFLEKLIKITQLKSDDEFELPVVLTDINSSIPTSLLVLKELGIFDLLKGKNQGK
ncbi:MAG: hypothetical protein IPM92_16845 [Saprospiraceae bacterium]|nr:hypothetical protein [Saprospiraceae bacterium]